MLRLSKHDGSEVNVRLPLADSLEATYVRGPMQVSTGAIGIVVIGQTICPEG